MMKYRRLGRTNLEVSVVCLGTMTYGEQNTETEAHEQLDYALSQGVNFIDTAELYAVPSNPKTQGLTEKYIGSWLQKSGKRDQVILATKVTGPSPNLTYISDNLGFSKSRIYEAVDKSLTRLQTDYIDLYQFHWPERKTNYFGQLGFPESADYKAKIDEQFRVSLEAIRDLIKQGKIRHFGVSNETPWGLHKYLEHSEYKDLPRVQSVQNPYNLLNRTYEVGMAEMSLREEMGLLAYSPMGFGLLSGKYHKGQTDENARLNKYKQMARYSSDECYKATASYLAIAEKYGLSLAQMSLSFVHSRSFTTATIIGATSMAQLRENITSIDVELSKELLEEIEAIHQHNSNPAP